MLDLAREITDVVYKESIVEETIKILIRKHGVTLTSKTIIHSDQGAHYTSIRFIVKIFKM